jgi:hypothetical protein
MLSRLLVAGLAGSAFLVGSLVNVSIVTTEFGSTAAYAKSNKSNKGGGHKSSSKGKSASAAGKSKSTGGPASNAKSQSDTSPVVTVSVKKAAKAEKIPGLDAKLGALHAMNANINAYIHASPNSRVGKIATYARSLVSVENAQTAFDDATELLNQVQDDLTNAQTDLDNSLADLAVLDPYGDYDYPDFTPDTLAARQAELETALATAATQDEIDAINSELDAIATANANRMAFDDATDSFNEASDNFDSAESDLMIAEDDAESALNDAANKTPIDDETRAYVDGQLEDRGILDYFRNETTADAPAVEDVEAAAEAEPVELN